MSVSLDGGMGSWKSVEAPPYAVGAPGGGGGPGGICDDFEWCTFLHDT